MRLQDSCNHKRWTIRYLTERITMSCVQTNTDTNKRNLQLHITAGTPTPTEPPIHASASSTTPACMDGPSARQSPSKIVWRKAVCDRRLGKHDGPLWKLGLKIQGR